MIGAITIIIIVGIEMKSIQKIRRSVKIAHDMYEFTLQDKGGDQDNQNLS